MSHIKLKYLIYKLIIILVISSIYILPVNINNNLDIIIESSKYNLFEINRLMFIILGISLLFINSKNKLKTFIYTVMIMAIGLIKILFYKELDFGLLYILVTFIVFDTLVQVKISTKTLEKTFNIAYWTYLTQLVIYSLIRYETTHKVQVWSSFNDANYTAYFVFCLGVYLYLKNKKLKAYTLFLIGIFTYSRLYILIVFIFIFILNLKQVKIKLKMNLNKYLVFQMGILIVSIIYILIYEKIRPEYVYLEGFNRMTNFLDESNYIRFKANLYALQSIDFKTIFLGVKEKEFIGINAFKGKNIFPHNLFWSLYVQYGLFITIMYCRRFVHIFNKIKNKLIIYPLLLLIYHSFLGLSSFYGFDLIIQLMMIRDIFYQEKGELNCKMKLN